MLKELTLKNFKAFRQQAVVPWPHYADLWGEQCRQKHNCPNFVFDEAVHGTGAAGAVPPV